MALPAQLRRLSETSSGTEWAPKYARRGWPVFPVHGIRNGKCTCGHGDCANPGKHPRTTHGVKDATCDERTIRRWFARWPDAGIALATGAGLVVLDVDPRHGGDKSLAAIEHGGILSTLESKTGGDGRHLFFTVPQGQVIRNSAGKLGPGLDVRGEGGYVVLPPSLHSSGNRYEWTTDVAPVPLPECLAVKLMESEPPAPNNSQHKIPEGQRNSELTSLAGTMRRRRMTPQAITAALIVENAARCNPPLPEGEVVRIANSVAQYNQTPADAQKRCPWSLAAGMDTFLESEEKGIDFLMAPVIAKEAVTEIFSPRGLGKSLWALFVAVFLAVSGCRVLLIDRDNSRRMLKERLRAFGATTDLTTLKVLTRENAPPLTDEKAWAEFPYQDFDLVIVDALDSAAEGIGEQDSSRPSRAIAKLLDIARRQNGPAVLVLGNTIKSAAHSRGSGVIEDRADIVFEVRDATNFHPTGTKPWIDELPAADAGSWAGRSTRRKRLAQYRLAFISTKFRVGEEPEPFIVEINLSLVPWTVRDVTDLVQREAAECRGQREDEVAGAAEQAVAALVTEIERRQSTGVTPLRKHEASAFLQTQQLTRQRSRQLVEAPNPRWHLARIVGPGSPVAVLPLGWNFDPVQGVYKRDGGEITELPEAAKTACFGDPSSRRADPQRVAETGHPEVIETKGLVEETLVAAVAFDAPPESLGSSEKSDADEVVL